MFFIHAQWFDITPRWLEESIVLQSIRRTRHVGFNLGGGFIRLPFLVPLFCFKIAGNLRIRKPRPADNGAGSSEPN